MAKSQVPAKRKSKLMIPETKDDSNAMKKVFSLSLEEIESVLDGKKAITDVTKLAACTLTNYSRVKSTEIHDKALEIMLAKSITK